MESVSFYYHFWFVSIFDILYITVGLDKSAVLILREDDPPITEPILESESQPQPVKASKRKSQEGNKRRAKQTKMSEFLDSPKKAQKRDNKSASTKVVTAKKLKIKKNDQEKRETDMEIAEQNDVIDLCDVSPSESPTRSNESNLSSTEEISNEKQSKTAEDNENTVNSTTAFLQTFKVKKKPTFKFAVPKKITNDFLNDNHVEVDPVDETKNDDETTKNDEIVKMRKSIPQPKKGTFYVDEDSLVQRFFRYNVGTTLCLSQLMQH